MHTSLETYLEKTPKEAQKKETIAYLALFEVIKERSPSIVRNIIQELHDQRSSIKMIASENYSSLPVQLAMANWLTDKYAEGYVQHRFYAGCEHIDAIEHEAGDLAKTLFGAEYAYVQPHSGADANLVAFLACLSKRVQPKVLEKYQKKLLTDLSEAEFLAMRHEFINQKVLVLSLNSGGHLTHGYKMNISSRLMIPVYYEVDPKTHLIDYDLIRSIAKKERPAILLAGYSAYSRKINFRIMKEIAQEVDADLMIDMAHFAGLVAGKAYEGEYNPVIYGDIVTSTTHKTLRGPRGGLILAKHHMKEFVDRGCPMILGGPLPHVMAAKAVAFREALDPCFQTYARQVITNAQKLAEALMKEGFHVITGGTDNHLLLVDVSPLGLTGRHAESALRRVKITVNKNTIPFDTNGPWITSGIRLGTAALTTRGFSEQEMTLLATLIAKTLRATAPAVLEHGKVSREVSITDEKVQKEVLHSIHEITEQFPLYPELCL